MTDPQDARTCPSCGAPMRRTGGTADPFWECTSCGHFDADPRGDGF